MFGISLHVWGEYACFTRPELKSERLSYEVMTPSAARGILSAVYWKPEFAWVVDRIRVLKPIRFAQIRRNEVKCRMPAPSAAVRAGKEADVVGFAVEENRQQRATTLLRDVGYVIEAHIKILKEQPGVNDVGKHLEIFKRRASRGQCFCQPCLGNREFPAMFELVEEGGVLPDGELPPEQRNKSLGLMFHDMVYEDDKKGAVRCAHTGKRQTATPRFFMAELKDGVLDVPPLNTSLS